jgi:hypothetical protein
MSRAPATLVVSLDFELYWGMRDQLTIERYGANLRGAREVVPRLLDRFCATGVRATWATVGMLFCESREELLARLPERRPSYREPHLSPYEHVASIGADERSDPLHFAPSLIREIAAAGSQEIATHTFSHYYCLEPEQTREEFDADLEAAVSVARDAGVALRSIVFPRNQVNPDYLPVCATHGLIAYRGNQAGWMHAPASAGGETYAHRAARLADAYVRVARRSGDARGSSELVDVPASRFFRPRSRSLRVLEGRKVSRIVGELEHAARTGGIYHLWWHPHNFGVDQDAHFAQLDAVLDRFARLREDGAMRSLTMAELAAEQAA